MTQEQQLSIFLQQAGHLEIAPISTTNQVK